MIAYLYKKRAIHLTQVATTSCGHDFQLFADMRLAAWQQHAASNGKIEAHGAKCANEPGYTHEIRRLPMAFTRVAP